MEVTPKELGLRTQAFPISSQETIPGSLETYKFVFPETWEIEQTNESL